MENAHENRLASRLFLAAKLSLLWVLFTVLSLGVLTGAAAGAVYKILFHLFRNDKTPDRLLHSFIQSMKTTLPHSIIMVLFSGLSFTLLFLWFQHADTTIAYVFIYFLGFELYIITMFSFPIQALFRHKNFFRMLKTTFLIGNIHALSAVGVLLTLLTAVLITYLYNYYAIPFMLVFFFYLTAVIFYRVLNLYTGKIDD